MGLCGALCADQKSSPAVEQSVDKGALVSGLDFVKEAREGFSSGAHKAFLEQADKTYQKNMKTHAYDTFLEARRDTSKITASLKDTPKPITVADFEKKSNELLSQRDRKLSDVIAKHEDESFAASLKNSVFFSFNEEQKSALSRFFDLHTKFKGEGTSPLENELIAIDTEYWLKQRDLDMAHIKGKYTGEEYAKYALVLELAKLDAMKNAALKEPESKLAHEILVAYGVYPTQAAIVYDQKKLVQLGEGKLASNTSFEQQVQGIMKEYIQERTELTAKYFPEQ